ncbi:MAG TPA: hypothetical protein DDY57_07895 [Franconibacter pulveris]|nr:hypothetical protein [Franconibacter pulveris]
MPGRSDGAQREKAGQWPAFFMAWSVSRQGGKPANPRELTQVSDRGAQALPTPLRRERRRERYSVPRSTSFPMDFVLRQGGKPANPRKLTQVSDRGAQALPTPLRRERRRESYSMPLLRR